MPVRSLARIYQATPHNLLHLAEVLRRGELVAVPTETVYGLAANAFDPAACRRIFLAKRRPSADPLIVHIYSRRQLNQVAVPNKTALLLAEAFWPGPLTLVLPKRSCIPSIVSAGLPSVAVRIPSHPLFRRLLNSSGLPLAAPSANPFGYISPTSAEHVRAGLGGRIRFILQGGECEIGLESTILDVRDPKQPLLLRPGAVTREQIENALGFSIASKPRGRSVKARAQVAPGLLKQHYSPRTPTVLHPRLREGEPAERPVDEAWIFFKRPSGPPAANVFWLDSTGDLMGAARRLFAVLRKVDSGTFSKIHVEKARGAGLAVAINDRLRRAAHA